MERFERSVLSRRSLIVGGLSLALSACSKKVLTHQSSVQAGDSLYLGNEQFDHEQIYASMQDGAYTLPAVSLNTLKPRHRRQIVRYSTKAKPGSVIVDLAQTHLYLVEAGGWAVRYGIGIGREGFRWSGTGVVNHGRTWPTWTPTSSMLARTPELDIYRNGMAGGLQNPLGARALYIYQNGHDTLYRLHGTPEWWTIGRAMSSGCIRMINQDVIDLSERVSDGAHIIVD